MPETPTAPERAPNFRLRLSGWAKSRAAYPIIVLLALATFANSLGNYFLMDDFWHLNKIAGIQWTDWWKPWSYSAGDNASYWMAMHRIRGIENADFFFRPAVTTLYGLIEAAGGGSAWSFHLSNILIHALTSLVFLGIARRFFGRNMASFGAAVLFVVHPAHCESVQWIAANADLLGGLFLSLAFYAHIRNRESGRGRWLAVALAGFFLSLCSKEMSIMFPAIALLYDLLFFRPGGEAAGWRPVLKSKSFYLVLAAYALIAAIYLIQHLRVLGQVAELNEGGNYIADWRQPGFVSTVLVNLAVYLWHFWTLFPVMPLDTREALRDAWWAVLPIWAALIGWFAWLLRKTRDRRMYCFCWGWQVLAVLPALPILMSQRVLYVPSIGFCLLIGLLLREHWIARWENGRRGGWVFPAAAAACLLVTVGMNTMWRKPSCLIREQIGQIALEVPRPEPGSRIFLIDVWQPSYGIEEGLRRHYGDRTLDVQVLSFHPRILQPGMGGGPLEKLFAAYFPEACGPLRTRHKLEGDPGGPVRLRLEVEDAVYFQGLVEGLLPVEPRLGGELRRVEQPLFSVELGASDRGVNRMDFVFADRASKAYFLVFENGRYRLITKP